MKTMKNKLQKILLIVVLLLGSQVVHAESYQRWIYWVTPTLSSHQVTAKEMAEITSMLYDGKISPNKVFRLSNGTSLKIPQPALYLQYIERCIKIIRPGSTHQEVVDAIAGAEKFRWGNDVSVLVKNYWVSNKDEKVVYTNNYTGEDKTVDFLFIDGVPSIKTDCGNPLGVIDYQIKKIPQKETEPVVDYLSKGSLTSKEDNTAAFPKDLGKAVLEMETKPSKSAAFPKKEKSGLKPWQKYAIGTAAGLIVAATTVYVVKNLPADKPAATPPSNIVVDDTGGAK